MVTIGRRAFVSLGAGGAAMALAGCATSGGKDGGDGVRNVRAESSELQAQKCRGLESARELGPTITDVEVRRTLPEPVSA